MIYGAGSFSEDSISGLAGSEIDFLVSGLPSTLAVGTPTAAPEIIGTDVGGLHSTSFGTPEAAQFFTAREVIGRPRSLYWTTNYGTPLAALPFVVESLGGISHLGTPVAITGERTCLVSGVSSATYGTPTGKLVTTGLVASVSGSSYGIPSATYAVTGVVASLNGVTIGTPSGPGRRKSKAVHVFIKQNVVHASRRKAA